MSQTLVLTNCLSWAYPWHGRSKVFIRASRSACGTCSDVIRVITVPCECWVFRARCRRSTKAAERAAPWHRANDEAKAPDAGSRPTSQHTTSTHHTSCSDRFSMVLAIRLYRRGVAFMRNTALAHRVVTSSQTPPAGQAKSVNLQTGYRAHRVSQTNRFASMFIGATTTYS